MCESCDRMYSKDNELTSDLIVVVMTFCINVCKLQVLKDFHDCKIDCSSQVEASLLNDTQRHHLSQLQIYSSITNTN
jgi:hypothetical protein